MFLSFLPGLLPNFSINSQFPLEELGRTESASRRAGMMRRFLAEETSSRDWEGKRYGCGDRASDLRGNSQQAGIQF